MELGIGVGDGSRRSLGDDRHCIAAAQDQELVSGVKTGKSVHITDPGPTDKHPDAANPDISVLPLTDAGGLPTFKYPFSLKNKRIYEGGWSREVTV
jgi:hypothetical protein